MISEGLRRAADRVESAFKDALAASEVHGDLPGHWVFVGATLNAEGTPAVVCLADEGSHIADTLGLIDWARLTYEQQFYDEAEDIE